MFVNPKTGKEIRILNTDASRWKDQKTLAFSSTVTPWDSVWTTHLEDGSPPTFRILLGKQSASSLKEAKGSRYIFTQHVDSQTKRLGFIPLEDLHLSFPQLGNEWDGTAEDAAAMIAQLFHYQRFFSKASPPRLTSLHNISLHTSLPEPLWLITQTYVSESKARTKEIDSCLKKNCENHLISGILLLNEAPSSYTHRKINEQVIGHRITYRDVMSAIQTLPENALVAFANADIVLDPISWRSLWAVNLKDVCIALLRYDVPSSGSLEGATLFGPRADSQDTWVVRAQDVKSRPSLLGSSFDIPFGTMGCDNVFALEMLRQKFCVINPCHTLITWHYHTSGVRTYKKEDVIDRPMFHYIHPSGLHDMKPCLDLKPFLTTTSTTVYRPIRGRGATTWLHNIGKVKGAASEWKLDSMHPLVSKPQKVLFLKNVYQTSMGLAYDSTSMYVGDGKEAQTIWAENPIIPLLSTLKSERGFIIPWPGAKREAYILHYLAKVLRLREISEWKDGDFFCPDDLSVQSAIKLFQWYITPLPLIRHERDIQIWHEEAFSLPVDDGSAQKEDIDILRRYSQWKESIDTESSFRTIVIVEGGTLVGKVNELEEVLQHSARVCVVYPGKTSPERMLSSLTGAWGIICPPGLEACGWNWMLPKGAHVFEVDSKDDVCLNMSAICGLEHRFVNYKDILEEILEDSTPVIYVPKPMEGHFSHPGDGFRELIDMWSEKGYIQKKEGSNTMCWWGDIGSVLLYDRGTHAWRVSAPMVEREYKHILLGGLKEVEKSSGWILWPRRPRMVQEFVEGGFHRNSWEKRSGYADTSLDPQEILVSLSNSLYMVYNGQKELLAECLAMGCVPVMENAPSLANPLEEGKHYIKDTLSRDEWERISANCHEWWKANCSCEASFQLTRDIISAL
jgi:hypothetical protein